MKAIHLAHAAASVLSLLFAAHASLAAIRDGELRLDPEGLRAGRTFDLTGQWLYRPGYTIPPTHLPEAPAAAGGVRVPVPQLLNRIRWWLDDSEDFNRDEDARLKALGFDADRAEDGWYYLRLNLPAISAGQRLFIEFDGVAMVSRTFCNGRLLGEHKGMFSRFSYELTPHLKAGDNLLAVFVSMEKTPPDSLSMGEAVTVNLTASKVRSMSKGMFGPLSPNFDNRAYDLHGIWQPVKLAVRGAGKLDDVWFVPSVDGAEVRVEARALGGPCLARLKATWTDAKTGQLFAGIEPQSVELGERSVMRTLTLANVNPKLWTPAEPNLYRLDVTLESEAGTVMDAWTRNVGFRTFEARGNQLLLNGKPYWLRGANHLPYGKNPFDPALARKLIQLLHEANIRVTRTHATPWNEAWLNAADEIGLGVSLEGIRPWALCGLIGPTPPDLFEHWLVENEDVVKRCRNHPSVLIYTIGNEMLLRDTKNLEKWRQLSDVVKQTRRLDPARPIICSSEYAREPDLYAGLIEPNGIDDGDLDAIHRYNNWYAASSFVTDAKFTTEMKRNAGRRPFIGQEMSTGYPDLDTGLPVLRYTRDLLTPQAWVGPHAYPGSDPAVFLEHHRAVTKRWAERLRFERGTNTAGFMLFAAECWFSHSYDARRVKPYPVVEAVREAFAPLGLALETGRRRFFAGETVETGVFVTNDDEDGRDFAGVELILEFTGPTPDRTIATQSLGRLESLPYFATRRLPIRLAMPQVAGARESLRCILRLMRNGMEISRTTEPIEVYATVAPEDSLHVKAATLDLGPELQKLARGSFHIVGEGLADLDDARVVLAGAQVLSETSTGKQLWDAAARGATVVLFSPGKRLGELFPDAILDAKGVVAEYGDFAPCANTALSAGLQPMDVKWWGRTDDWRVFVAGFAHRLKPGGPARELIRFIPPHGYIPAEKLPEQYWTVLFEILVARGRFWICDLDVEASVSVDPAARAFAGNLLRAAADRDSTRTLPRMPAHEERLRARN